MGKEKHGFLTPKAIGNRIKAKGLQKLKWYCQMCEKQCRDDNGFKCHMLSESHQRQLLLVAENPHLYVNAFSKEFRDAFVYVLKRRFGTKRVKANNVYKEYISDRHHLHMNATQWTTLTNFVQYLGRNGFCKVDNTEKGWFITYIDRDPETLAREKKARKREKLEIDDADITMKTIQQQIERDKQRESLKDDTQNPTKSSMPLESNSNSIDIQSEVSEAESDNSSISHRSSSSSDSQKSYDSQSSKPRSKKILPRKKRKQDNEKEKKIEGGLLLRAVEPQTDEEKLTIAFKKTLNTLEPLPQLSAKPAAIFFNNVTKSPSHFVNSNSRLNDDTFVPSNKSKNILRYHKKPMYIPESIDKKSLNSHYNKNPSGSANLNTGNGNSLKKFKSKFEWVIPGIIIKIIPPQTTQAPYKATVKDVKSKFIEEKLCLTTIKCVKPGTNTPELPMIELTENIATSSKSTNDEATYKIETVLPNLSRKVLILRGPYKGNLGTMQGLEEKTYSAIISIDDDSSHNDRELKMSYEDICKIDENFF